MILPTNFMVLMDLDGTLADSLSVMLNAYQLFLKQFRREATNAEFDSLNGPPFEEIVHRLKISHSLEEDESVLRAKYFDIIDNAYASVKPCKGAEYFLQKAKQYHCIIGVVTSNTKKRTQFWLETVGFAHMIDFIVAGDDVKYGKPYPEPYIIASKKTSYNLNQIVAIEDSLQGVQSATAAGLQTIVIGSETVGHAWPEKVEQAPSLLEAAEKLFASDQVFSIEL